MKTLDWVKDHLDELDTFIDSRFTKRFIDFLPAEEWPKYGFELKDEKICT